MHPFFEYTIMARFEHRILYSIHTPLRKEQKDKKQKND